jgi:hypothetical protein
MECDLCKHGAVYSENNLLCESCAEMIQRLLIVQKHLDTLKPQKAAAAFAPSSGISLWVNLQ